MPKETPSKFVTSLETGYCAAIASQGGSMWFARARHRLERQLPEYRSPHVPEPVHDALALVAQTPATSPAESRNMPVTFMMPHSRLFRRAGQLIRSVIVVDSSKGVLTRKRWPSADTS